MRRMPDLGSEHREVVEALTGIYCGSGGDLRAQMERNESGL